jgi:hypothetical protein
MSTIKVTNIQATGETASRAVSGVASAWVNFDGTGTIAARDSFNVASLTDNNTGQYRITYTSSMASASNVLAQSADGTFNGTICSIGFGDSQNNGLTSTHHDHESRGGNGNGNLQNSVITTNAIFGDLA